MTTYEFLTAMSKLVLPSKSAIRVAEITINWSLASDKLYPNNKNSKTSMVRRHQGQMIQNQS